LLYPLLLLALLAFQRGRLAGLVLAAGVLSSLPSGPSYAAEAPWYLNADQAGVRALRGGEPDAPLCVLEDPRWRATALYRNKEFDAAASAFAAFDDISGPLERGKRSPQGGRFITPLGALDAPLSPTRPPHFEDAVRNRALVAELLEKAKAAAENKKGETKIILCVVEGGPNPLSNYSQ
jgi:hypothetical protein